jgi:hypothetical protein
MSFSYVEDNDIIPNVFLLTSELENPIRDFEYRLSELLTQRTHLLQPLNSTTVINQIPTNEVISFCGDYKDKKRKLDHVASQIQILNDNKSKVEKSYNNVIEGLKTIIEFIKTNEDYINIYKDIINKVVDLTSKSKEAVCQSEASLLEEQTKLSNYISECIELFGLVDKEISKNVEKPNIDEKISIACPVCYERNVNSVYIPCGHTICNQCCNKVFSQTCVICRKKAKAIPFYLAN